MAYQIETLEKRNFTCYQPNANTNDGERLRSSQVEKRSVMIFESSNRRTSTLPQFSKYTRGFALSFDWIPLSIAESSWLLDREFDVCKQNRWTAWETLTTRVDDTRSMFLMIGTLDTRFVRCYWNACYSQCRTYILYICYVDCCAAGSCQMNCETHGFRGKMRKRQWVDFGFDVI